MNAKSLGIFALGSFFGLIGGVLVSKKHYQKIMDEEIAEIKSVYTYKKPESDENSEKDGFKYIKFKGKEDKKTVRDEENSTDFKRVAENIINYSGYAVSDNEKLRDVGINEEKTVDPAESEHPKDDDTESDDPYPIEAEDAGYGFDCVSLTYYPESGLLFETGTSKEIGITESIGQEAISRCMDQWEIDPDDALYFRNEKLGLDYEVLMSDKDYDYMARTIDGVEE